MRRKTYKFENLDGTTWRSVGGNVRRSLERAAAVNGYDAVFVKGRRYSLQSSADLERAAQAIERESGN